MKLEKVKVVTMAAANFSNRARRAFAPMRKAAMDALLLSAFVYIGLFAFPQILLSYPWLFLPIYACSYIPMLALRLRQAAHQTTEPRSPYNYLFH